MKLDTKPPPSNTTTTNNNNNTTSDIESDNESSVISASTNRSDHSTATNRRSIKGKRRLKTKQRPSLSKPVKTLFRFNCFVAEDTPKQIFAVQFCHFLKNRNIFATASGFRISIFECIDDDSEEPEGEEAIADGGDFCGMKLLRAYDDPDRDEVFYTLAWGYEGNCPIVAFGGVRSVVRAIYLNCRNLKEKKFIGHTNAINDMKFHPTQPHLLLTASKDHSLRLWNVKTEICVSMWSSGGVVRGFFGMVNGYFLLASWNFSWSELGHVGSSYFHGGQSWFMNICVGSCWLNLNSTWTINI
jgi:polycomb protein EED